MNLTRIVGLLLLSYMLVLESCKNKIYPAPLGFSEELTFDTHREVEVGWESTDGIVLSGTLFFPRDAGIYAAVIWHFGSNKWTRSPFDNSAAKRWLENGIAVLTYDKRGVGKSQGECCPFADPDYFLNLGQDVLSGARLIAEHPEIDPNKVGAFGFSQGGWVLPVAAAESGGTIAFTIIGSGPTVTLGEELLYSALTGENDCRPSGLSMEEIDRQLKEEGPSLFDPLPYLLRMQNPGLWIFGEVDLSVPVRQSIAILDTLINNENKPFTHITIPNANHGWIIDGGICPSGENEQEVDMLPQIFQWISDQI